MSHCTKWLATAFLTGIVVVGLTMPSRAQEQPDERLFTRLSDQTLERIMGRMNYPFERKVDKFGAYYLVTINNYKSILVNKGDSLMIECLGFKDRNKRDIPLERMNEWNQKKRFCRAFVDRQGYGIMQSDLDIFPGSNEKIVQEWFRMYGTLLKDFASFTY